VQEKPTAEDVRQWMREGRNVVEEASRAKQKAIWQGQVDEAASEVIAREFGAIYDDMEVELETAASMLNNSEAKRFTLMARIRELEALQ
jgi:hypothetical protein